MTEPSADRSPAVAARPPLDIDLLAMWPSIAAVASGGTVISSVLYNYAYFHVVDPGLLQLLTVSDHITSALTWLAATVLLPAFVLGMFFFLTPSQNGGPRSPKEPTVPKRELSPFMALIKIGCGWLIFLIAYIGLQEISPPEGWWETTTVGMITWSTYTAFRGRRRWGMQLYLWVTFGPLLILGGIGAGSYAAYVDFRVSTPDTRIVVKDRPDVENVHVLRRLERGLLARDISTDTVRFIPWSEIREYDTLGRKVEQRTLVCIRWNILCPEAGQAPSLVK